MSEVYFKINEYIELRLEEGQTNIYINNKRFLQCKYLLLNLAPKDFEKFDEIDSIDDAFEIYNNQMDRGNESNKMILSPEQEFIGHCSNLQVWAEYNYDTRILHSSLSFPLLRELSKTGDEYATIRLKEEVFKRLESKNKNTAIYFLEEGYLHLFSYEELEALFEAISIENDRLLKKIDKLMTLKHFQQKQKEKIEEMKRRGMRTIHTIPMYE